MERDFLFKLILRPKTIRLEIIIIETFKHGRNT